MKVNDLIEFLEYSDRNAPIVLGILDDDGRVRTCEEVLFLNHEGRVCLIMEPSIQSTEASETKEPLRLDDFERKQLFGHNFVLLRKPPLHRS